VTFFLSHTLSLTHSRSLSDTQSLSLSLSLTLSLSFSHYIALQVEKQLAVETRAFKEASGINSSIKDLTAAQVCRVYLTERVDQVVLQKTIPAQIRRLILYDSNNGGKVDEFMWELTSAKTTLWFFFSDEIAQLDEFVRKLTLVKRLYRHIM